MRRQFYCDRDLTVYHAPNMQCRYELNFISYDDFSFLSVEILVLKVHVYLHYSNVHRKFCWFSYQNAKGLSYLHAGL